MPDYEIKVEVALQHDGEKWIWFHPRVAAAPGLGHQGAPAVVMTIQKHLMTSDHYSGLHALRTDDLGLTWTSPDAVPELAWRSESDQVDIAVCDVTPGWHGPSGRLLAIGAQVRYSPQGHQLDDKVRAHQTAYTVHDPKHGTWSPWAEIPMPPAEHFNYARSACSQWITEGDGTLLVPFYVGPDSKQPHAITVVRFAFDGRRLTPVAQGNLLRLDVDRGLCEPSLVRFGGRYFLTIRNDQRGYVAVSEDGLNYAPQKPWTFDDGSELGSYNTQQHWLAHSDGLLLTYTRRGVSNDHIMRHRAPLLIAQVDPEKLCVIRETERILIPECGVPMGNFGAAPINEHESWVTVSEFMWPQWNEQARKRGAAGRTFVARVVWKTPNALARPE